MSAKSNNQGRAYEYAWIKTLYTVLNDIRKTKIIHNSSLIANEQAWLDMTEEMKNIFLLSAESTIEKIIELEPNLIESDDELILKFLKDEEGIKADVRDIVINREGIGWEIGLSIKHNHHAVKHSRLSHKLDFGKQWYSSSCSEDYWDAVTPIFERLKKEKRLGTKWMDLGNKNEEIYIPLLEAFMNEIKKSIVEDKAVPRKLVEYLVGTKDYYKIISADKKRITLIQTFNMNDTLNQTDEIKKTEIKIPILELPTRLVALEFKPESKNTVEMYLDNGWQLSFRIHNASTKVEPSLKFDIQFVGVPVSILQIECSWKN